MAQYPYLPFYPGDFWIKTNHLEGPVRNGYLALLMSAWMRPGCALPDDDDELACMVGVSKRVWINKYRDKIAKFFIIEDGRWINKRLREERAWVEEAQRSNPKRQAERGQRRAATAERDQHGRFVSASAAVPEPLPPTVPASPSREVTETGASAIYPTPSPSSPATDQPATSQAGSGWSVNHQPPRPRVNSSLRSELTTAQHDEKTERNGEKEEEPQCASTQKENEFEKNFEAFWGKYPRKLDKKKAAKAFKKILKTGKDPTKIIEGTGRYATETVHTEARYIKHPATWLNGACWENEPEPKRMETSYDGSESWTGRAYPARQTHFEQACEVIGWYERRAALHKANTSPSHRTGPTTANGACDTGWTGQGQGAFAYACEGEGVEYV